MREHQHRRRQHVELIATGYGGSLQEKYQHRRDQQDDRPRNQHQHQHQHNHNHNHNHNHTRHEPCGTSARRAIWPEVPYDSYVVLNPFGGSLPYAYVPARRRSNPFAPQEHSPLTRHERGRSRERAKAGGAKAGGERAGSRNRHRERSRTTERSVGAEAEVFGNERPQKERSSRRRSRQKNQTGYAASATPLAPRPWVPDQGMALASLPRASTSLGRRLARSPSFPAQNILSQNLLSYPLPANVTSLSHRFSLSTSAARFAAANAAAAASSAPLSFHIAASFVGKDFRFDPSHHTFEVDRNLKSRFPTPHLASREHRIQSGHDSFFVSRVGDDGAMAFGVADGVGGYVNYGVDPADFSHALCAHMAEAAASADVDKLTPRSIMHAGWVQSCHDPQVRAGGSTACVAVASPRGVLDVANLGDSGFMVLRSRAVHTFSPPQQHAFNTPFQMSVVPPHALSRITRFGGGGHVDLASDADVSSVALRRGDVVIFATDGMWDNLFNQDVLHIACRVMKRRGVWEQDDAESGVRVSDDLERLVRIDVGRPSLQAQAQTYAQTRTHAYAHSNAHRTTLQSELASELVVAAKTTSNTKLAVTPFGKSVRQHFPNEPWLGGKVDDICVVVMVVADTTKDVKSRL